MSGLEEMSTVAKYGWPLLLGGLTLGYLYLTRNPPARKRRGRTGSSSYAPPGFEAFDAKSVASGGHSNEALRTGQTVGRKLRSELYVADLKKQYEHVPPFVPGQFPKAMSQAKGRGQAMCVVLHSPPSAAITPGGNSSDPLIAALCTESVTDFIKTNFTPWLALTATPECIPISRALRVQSYPFLCVLSVKSGNQMVVLAKQEGVVMDESHLIAWLVGALERKEDFDAQLLARMTARERAIQADRDIREQQDREYQQMLQEDQAREESIKMAKEAEERAEKKRQEEAERLRKAQEDEERLTKLRAERRNALLETLPAEPDNGPDVLTIQVIMPDGSRIRRRWKQHHPVPLVLRWVHCHRIPSAEEGELIPSCLDESHTSWPAALSTLPSSHAQPYRLVTPVPRMVIHSHHEQQEEEGDGVKTLKDLRLGRQVLLVVEDKAAHHKARTMSSSERPEESEEEESDESSDEE